MRVQIQMLLGKLLRLLHHRPGNCGHQLPDLRAPARKPPPNSSYPSRMHERAYCSRWEWSEDSWHRQTSDTTSHRPRLPETLSNPRRPPIECRSLLQFAPLYDAPAAPARAYTAATQAPNSAAAAPSLEAPGVQVGGQLASRSTEPLWKPWETRRVLKQPPTASSCAPSSSGHAFSSCAARRQAVRAGGGGWEASRSASRISKT
mmetsp:Transcript_2572/g.6225  ORF Transcript_2572/g.6225 Transcript_2572/m.6225 type:complete len:204 (-) Transcript_2572:9-620(-)